MKLTDRFLSNLKFKGKQTKVFDDGLPNFGVRVYQSGVSFIVMLGTERRMKTIGKYPAMSLKEARKRAVVILNEIDPYLNIKSVQSSIDEFLAHSTRINRPRTTGDYTRLLNRHLPKGTLKDISRNQLIKRLESLSKTPV